MSWKALFEARIEVGRKELSNFTKNSQKRLEDFAKRRYNRNV